MGLNKNGAGKVILHVYQCNSDFQTHSYVLLCIKNTAKFGHSFINSKQATLETNAHTKADDDSAGYEDLQEQRIRK